MSHTAKVIQSSFKFQIVVLFYFNLHNSLLYIKTAKSKLHSKNCLNTILWVNLLRMNCIWVYLSLPSSVERHFTFLTEGCRMEESKHCDKKKVFSSSKIILKIRYQSLLKVNSRKIHFLLNVA